MAGPCQASQRRSCEATGMFMMCSAEPAATVMTGVILVTSQLTPTFLFDDPDHLRGTEMTVAAYALAGDKVECLRQTLIIYHPRRLDRLLPVVVPLL